MTVKTEKELNETQRALWLKAMAAVELRNFGYAISLLQGILKQQPQFLTGRQLLRRAEVAKQKARKKSFFNISTAPITLMKAQREIKKAPRRAVEMIERVLQDEPYNRQANTALKEAAIAAGWPEIGVFALRTLLEENPRDVKLLHELGQLHHQMGESQEEVEVYNRITEIDPLDAVASRLGKDASARASMSAGGWAQAESYRELIKDKEVAISLEQQGRMQLTGEALDQQITELETRQRAEPMNVDVTRRLGSLCEQKDDIESAIKWYQRAAELTGSGDAGLARKLSDLKMRSAEREIAAHEEYLAAHQTKDAVHARKTEEFQAAKKKQAGLLLEEAKKRVERNPTDLQLRFELGMLDLAAKQFEDAAKEILTMDAMKKEIVYNLGIVYEKTGEREKSLGCMKQIYEADYGYKDVADRVESSYQQD